MARLMFSVFAERVAIDRTSNALDVLNVLETIGVPEIPATVVANARRQKRQPAIPGRFALLTHWRRSSLSKGEGNLRQRVQMFSPKGELLSVGEIEFTLRNSEYVRNVVLFQALPVVGEGTYTARISLRSGRRWRQVGEASFEMRYLKPVVPGEKARIH
jgi:hypothetical protein